MSKVSLRRENEVQEVTSHVSNLNELVGKREDPWRSMEGSQRKPKSILLTAAHGSPHLCLQILMRRWSLWYNVFIGINQINTLIFWQIHFVPICAHLAFVIGVWLPEQVGLQQEEGIGHAKEGTVAQWTSFSEWINILASVLEKTWGESLCRSELLKRYHGMTFCS